MKLLSLNTWFGKIHEPLLNFIAAQAQDIDIFCFQETSRSLDNKTTVRSFRANLFDELATILPEHYGYYATTQDMREEKPHYPLQGLTTFVRKSIPVTDHGDVFVWGKKNLRIGKPGAAIIGRNMQFVKIMADEKPLTIFNLHGHWCPGTKEDVPERIEQAYNVRKVMKEHRGAKILCGDFNLLPQTKSLAIMAAGMQNLVADYHIKTTRSRLYDWHDKYADYTLVPPDVTVKNFLVPSVVVSDHLPMITEFTLK